MKRKTHIIALGRQKARAQKGGRCFKTLLGKGREGQRTSIKKPLPTRQFCRKAIRQKERERIVLSFTCKRRSDLQFLNE